MSEERILALPQERVYGVGGKREQRLPIEWLGIAGVPLSLVCAVAVDAAMLPWRHLSHSYQASAAFTETAAHLALTYVVRFPHVVGLQVVMGLLLCAAGRLPWPRQLLLGVVSSSALAASAYRILVDYERFRGYPPFIVAAIGLAVIWLLASQPAAAHRFGRCLRLLAGGAAAAAAAFSFYAHTQYFKGYYPSLHLALLVVGAVSTQAALAATTSLADLSGGARQLRRGLVALALVTSAFLLAVRVVAPVPAGLRPYVSGFAILGAETSSVDEQPPSVRCAEVGETMGEAEARKVFDAYSGLPALPPDFALERFNVLVVMIDSLRFDQTTLHSPTLGTTPTFERLRQSGAFVFTQARAPSTTTVQATASILSLRLPIHTLLAFGAQHWVGTLASESQTVAEVFQAEGYRTFHVLHAVMRQCCGESLSQGFAIRDIEGDEETLLSTAPSAAAMKREIDTRISEQAIATIRTLAKADARFFGWVFFFGPHHPYWARKPGRWSELELYQQAVQTADAELGRLVDFLQESGLGQRTVLLVLGDHGEQFGEHGGSSHANNVYAELKRVPLLISIPGVRGGLREAPTSTAYALPWLLLRGTRGMQTAALAALTQSLSPVMRSTEGGVPVELYLGRSCAARAALDFPDASIHYRYRAGLTELYDLRNDPGERDDRFSRGHPQEKQLVRLLGRYLRQPRCRY